MNLRSEFESKEHLARDLGLALSDDPCLMTFVEVSMACLARTIGQLS